MEVASERAASLPPKEEEARLRGRVDDTDESADDDDTPVDGRRKVAMACHGTGLRRAPSPAVVA